MLRHEIGNIRSTQATDFRLEDDLAGFAWHGLRIIDQFNFSSLGDSASQHGRELYKGETKIRRKFWLSEPAASKRIAALPPESRLWVFCATKVRDAVLQIPGRTPTCASPRACFVAGFALEATLAIG